MLLFAPSGDEQSLFVTDKASPGLILFSGLKTFFFFSLLCNFSLSSGDGSISYSCQIIQSSPRSLALFFVLIFALSAFLTAC